MKLKQAQFARAADMNNGNIRDELRAGKLVLGADKMLDTLDDMNANWLRMRGVNPNDIDLEKALKTSTSKKTATKSTKKVSKNNAPTKQQPTATIPDSEISELTGVPEKLLHMPFADLMRKYQNMEKLKGAVDIYYKLMQAHKIDIDTQTKRGDLVPSEAFSFLFSFIQKLIVQYNDFSEAAYSNLKPLFDLDEKQARIEVTNFIKQTNTRLTNEAQKKIESEYKKFMKDFKKKNEEGETIK